MTTDFVAIDPDPCSVFKKSQASKLGGAPVGIPSYFFGNYQLVSVEPKYLLLHMMCAILRISFYFACCFNKNTYIWNLNKRESTISYLFT